MSLPIFVGVLFWKFLVSLDPWFGSSFVEMTSSLPTDDLSLVALAVDVFGAL